MTIGTDARLHIVTATAATGAKLAFVAIAETPAAAIAAVTEEYALPGIVAPWRLTAFPYARRCLFLDAGDPTTTQAPTPRAARP